MLLSCGLLRKTHIWNIIYRYFKNKFILNLKREWFTTFYYDFIQVYYKIYENEDNTFLSINYLSRLKRVYNSSTEHKRLIMYLQVTEYFFFFFIMGVPVNRCLTHHPIYHTIPCKINWYLIFYLQMEIIFTVAVFSVLKKDKKQIIINKKVSRNNEFYLIIFK